MANTARRYRYRPQTPFNTAIRLMIPTIRAVKGNREKVYPDPETAPVIYGCFRTFGGTDTTENDVYTVISTGYIDTWYRPDITADVRFLIIETGEIYEVLGRPEDIQMRHQHMRIRVQEVGGTA